jgi:hypothetical protein
MPYPDSCPECASTFRNTGTHFTTRRSEAGRHVLLELGCQTTNRRFWWNFTTGQLEGDQPRLIDAGALGAAAGNGKENGHVLLSTVQNADEAEAEPPTAPRDVPPSQAPADSGATRTDPSASSAVAAPADLREAFLRQLQLDRLTMRQMRSWLMAEEARRAAEVAASATEATYERLALALYGVDLAQLLGRAPAVPPSAVMSAEERLELQREKARIRARQRRAALKAQRLAQGE